jgi:hypothetical protein
MWQHRRLLLYTIPLIAFLVSVMLYTISSFWFWRVMAYVAVFHFIRQQYGFMRLYSRKELQSKLEFWIDKLVIYVATIYPILFWHLSSDRSFNWFVEGDFLLVKSNYLLAASTILYYIIVVVYLVKTLVQVAKLKTVNIPKQLVIIGAHSDVAWDAKLLKIKWLSPVMWVVERTISTPATHHAHHGRHYSDPAVNYKGNFGNLLFFWDVLFGTAKITRTYPQSYGVENLPEATLGQQLAWPLFPEAKASQKN